VAQQEDLGVLPQRVAPRETRRREQS
jgi:hypothetical protein